MNQMNGENHLAVRQDQTQLMLLYPLLACCKLELSGYGSQAHSVTLTHIVRDGIHSHVQSQDSLLPHGSFLCLSLGLVT